MNTEQVCQVFSLALAIYFLLVANRGVDDILGHVFVDCNCCLSYITAAAYLQFVMSSPKQKSMSESTDDFRFSLETPPRLKNCFYSIFFVKWTHVIISKLFHRSVTQDWNACGPCNTAWDQILKSVTAISGLGSLTFSVIFCVYFDKTQRQLEVLEAQRDGLSRAVH